MAGVIGNNGFQNKPLQAMLAIGLVKSDSARIWFRLPGEEAASLYWGEPQQPARAECRVMTAGVACDFTGSELIDQGLQPDSRYWVELRSLSGTLLAEGQFTTAMASQTDNSREVFALISCHQPFDDKGRVLGEARKALVAMDKACKAHGVRQIIMCGDQLYSDQPQSLSLFNPAYFSTVAPPGREQLLDCSTEEVRSLFHARYRQFWNIDEWRTLMSSYSCVPILDDHDIVDNWGSAVEHHSSEWQAFRNGALQAYQDYQGALLGSPSNQVPDDFDCDAVYTDSAIYLMDLRSNRRVGEDPRIYSDNQFRRLQAFFAQNAEKSVLFLVLSVPPVHLPKALTRLVALITPEGEDFSDRWSSRGHTLDRDRLFRLIQEHHKRHPEQKLVILSGDIHIGCLHQLSWQNRVPNLYQLVSSGITHDTGWLVQKVSAGIMRLKQTLRVEGGSPAKVSLLGGSNNPCDGLNFGIVEVTRQAPGEPAGLQFFLYSNDGEEPVCRYQSRLIE